MAYRHERCNVAANTPQTKRTSLGTDTPREGLTQECTSRNQLLLGRPPQQYNTNTNTLCTWPLFAGVPSAFGPPAWPAFLARFLFRKFLSSRCTCSSSSSRSTPDSEPAVDPPRDARSAVAASPDGLLRPPAKLPRVGDVSALGGLLSSAGGRLRRRQERAVAVKMKSDTPTQGWASFWGEGRRGVNCREQSTIKVDYHSDN